MLDLVRDRGRHLHESVLSLLSPDLRAPLEDSLTLTWIPIAVDIAVVEAVDRVLGRATLHDIVLARQQREVGSPLLRRFASAALSLAGTSPAYVVRRIPDVWGLLFRNCGRFAIEEQGPTSTCLAIHGMPGECLASAAWMSGVRVACGAATAFVKRPGEAALEIRAGTARLTISWV